MAQTVGKSGFLPLLPATLFLLNSLAWLPLESYCHLWFENGLPTYNWKIESLSDLGVNYRQVHELKHYNVTSYAFQYMNANFIQAGVAFALAQLGLIWMTRRNVTTQTAFLRTVRAVLSLFVLGGFVLIGTIHGGPREKFWKIIGWHWFGWGMVAIAGNLNSFLSTVRANQVGAFEGNQIYRLVSSMLAGFGIYSYYRFNTLGVWDFETPIGLWQRGIVYPVLVWELLTGGFMLMDAFSGQAGGKVKKG
ncbi:hypothetical protein Slin15195_G104300 [Septoria linicola]|uniref:DUF998 domain-containing protein n=1 Tax=Septoria linicola TaxID=215465 RepID=A0A9Q9B4N2_9PEZI|nr:hypothetical protein Slin14017_G067340 [Septoria linicola]USW57111.1 hypothetical protein Slin15195_G104300 [Septoria linicola]